jgi:hypothetical protein
MQDAEAKAQRRWLFFKKIRRYQWHFVGLIVACGIIAILWRVVAGPPEPHQQRLEVQPQNRTATETTENPNFPVPGRSVALESRLSGNPPEEPNVSSNSVEEINPSESQSTSEALQGGLGGISSGISDGISSETFEAELENAESIGNFREPGLIVRADGISEEFERYRSFANDKYVGQIVQITGDVKQIDTSTKVPYVILKTRKPPQIRCLLSAAAKEALYKIKPGMRVTLRGTCDGAFTELIISECDVIL